MNDKNDRTGTDMVEDLSALVFDLDEFPSSERAREILKEQGIDTTTLKSWATEKLMWCARWNTRTKSEKAADNGSGALCWPNVKVEARGE